MGDRRRGTVDRRKETGEGGQEMGDRKGTGDGRQEKVEGSDVISEKFCRSIYQFLKNASR